MFKVGVMAGLVFLTMVVSTGCSRPEGVSRDPDESARRSNNSTPQFKALPQLPSEFRDMGAECKDPREMRAGVDACGKNGRIAKVRTASQQRLWPDQLTTIKLANPPEGQPGMGGAPLRDIWVGFEPNRLWISGDCWICRMSGFETMVVELANVSDDALTELQRMMHLPTSPVLRTADDFYRALATRKAS